MTGGGLLQLVAYGAQDIYLTGNPQITFFKVSYRRHTNFSMESIEQTFNGTADFGKRVTCTISRNGDLIYRVYLQVTLPAVQVPNSSAAFRWINYIGLFLIKSVELEIGGQRIDKHYGDWLNIWNELTQPPGKQVGFDNMVGNTVALTGAGLNSTEATTLYVPLQFWFCRNQGLALPLIALQYHEVKINLEFRNKNECYVASETATNCGSIGGLSGFCVPSLEGASLYVDYIYLDTDERRRFAQSSHEYLIEQLQFTGDENITAVAQKIRLNFNHPVKELVWVIQRDAVTAPNVNQWNNYTDDFDNDSSDLDLNTFVQNDGFTAPTNAAAIQALLNTNVEAGYTAQSFPSLGVNGANFTDAQVGPINFPLGPGAGVTNQAPVNFDYYNNDGSGADHAGFAPRNAGRNPTVRGKLLLNGHDRFSERLGSYFNLVQPYQHHTNIPATGINVYSFALQPEEHQPSGTCNMSRIDNVTLQLQVTPLAATGSKIRVYAVNYNVLRIMSGMGGLAYSN
jgi:hypothetical protein